MKSVADEHPWVGYSFAFVILIAVIVAFIAAGKESYDHIKWCQDTCAPGAYHIEDNKCYCQRGDEWKIQFPK